MKNIFIENQLNSYGPNPKYFIQLIDYLMEQDNESFTRYIFSRLEIEDKREVLKHYAGKKDCQTTIFLIDCL